MRPGLAGRDWQRLVETGRDWFHETEEYKKGRH